MTSIIETINLTKRFKLKNPKKEIIAVDDVNFKVNEGEVLGIMGPNGAGKTTLLKLLAGVLSPSQGTAVVCGHDVLKEREKVKACVSLLLPPSWIVRVIDYMSLRENLEFYGRLYGLSRNVIKERINKLSKVLDIENELDSIVAYLSTGMARRGELAKTFFIKTPILFLDEPTRSIDPGTAYLIRRFTKNLVEKERVTVLIATQYAEEAELLCDRVAIMMNGKVIALDSPRNLKGLIPNSINTIEVKSDFMWNVPAITTKLKELDDVVNVHVHIEDNVIASGVLRVHCTEVGNVTPRLLYLLSVEGCKVRYIKTKEPTLEDVFIYLIKRKLR